jgi:hypothetical protein
MLGGLVVSQIEATCRSLTSGRRSVFDPRPIQQALHLTPAMKAKQTRNINLFLNSQKYKNLMKQLQKDFDIALTK